MLILEVFSGTGSVGKVAKELGHEVVSLDMDMKADIKTDIVDWDYKSSYQPGHFDVVWASPPLHGIRQGHEPGRPQAGAGQRHRQEDARDRRVL